MRPLIGNLLHGRFRNGPKLIFQLSQIATGHHARQLFHEKPAFAPTSQAKLTDQLLVTSFTAGSAANTRQELAIRVRVRGTRHRLSIRRNCIRLL